MSKVIGGIIINMAKFTSKEPKPRTGKAKGQFGIGVFGTARFGETSGRGWDKEAKASASFSKVAKP